MDVVSSASTVTLLALTGAAVVMDLVRMKISNRLIVIGLLSAVLFRIWKSGTDDLVPCLGNMVFPVILFYLLFLIGALGAGDIKLFSVIGGFLNFRQLMQCIVLAFLAGAAVSLGKMIVCGNLRRGILSVGQYVRGLSMGEYGRYPVQSDEQKIHFSLYIWLGLMITLLFAG